MFDEKKQKFLFKCRYCQMIVSVELEEEEDLIKVRENLFILDCPCEGKCYVLRD